MPTETDHDLLVRHDTKLENIDKTTIRIETKMDAFDTRLRKKINWSHLGIIAAVVAAILAGAKYVPIAIALI